MTVGATMYFWRRSTHNSKRYLSVLRKGRYISVNKRLRKTRSAYPHCCTLVSLSHHFLKFHSLRFRTKDKEQQKISRSSHLRDPSSHFKTQSRLSIPSSPFRFICYIFPVSLYCI